jgi:hypothetical protein
VLQGYEDATSDVEQMTASPFCVNLALDSPIVDENGLTWQKMEDEEVTGEK